MLKKVFTFFFISAIALLIWAFVVEPYRLILERVSIVSAKWPRSLDGMKILIASDFHAGSFFGEDFRMRRIIDAMKVQNADIILLLGDYVNQPFYSRKSTSANVMDFNKYSALLAELKAPYGVWGILGNHDLSLNNAKGVRAMLKNAGVKLLRNELVQVQTPRGSFALYGAIVSAETSSFPNWVMAKVPEKIPLLALTHSPDGAVVLNGRPVAIFAGHTHGGQVCLPFYGAMWANSRYGLRFADGLSDLGESFLYTSRGLGTSKIAARFLCPPTLTLVTMWSADSGIKSTPAKPALDIE